MNICGYAYVVTLSYSAEFFIHYCVLFVRSGRVMLLKGGERRDEKETPLSLRLARLAYSIRLSQEITNSHDMTCNSEEPRNK